MTTMTNIYERLEAKVPTAPKLSMGQLGLTTKAVRLSEIANPAQLNMEKLFDRMGQEATNTWWSALPTELFKATSPPSTNELPTSFKGNTMCPTWDKLIFSPSPTTVQTTIDESTSTS